MLKYRRAKMMMAAGALTFTAVGMGIPTFAPVAHAAGAVSANSCTVYPVNVNAEGACKHISGGSFHGHVEVASGPNGSGRYANTTSRLWHNGSSSIAAISLGTTKREYKSYLWKHISGSNYQKLASAGSSFG